MNGDEDDVLGPLHVRRWSRGVQWSHHRMATFQAETVLSIDMVAPHSPTMIKQRGSLG